MWNCFLQSPQLYFTSGFIIFILYQVRIAILVYLLYFCNRVLYNTSMGCKMSELVCVNVQQLTTENNAHVQWRRQQGTCPGCKEDLCPGCAPAVGWSLGGESRDSSSQLPVDNTKKILFDKILVQTYLSLLTWCDSKSYLVLLLAY